MFATTAQVPYLTLSPRKLISHDLSVHIPTSNLRSTSYDSCNGYLQGSDLPPK